MIADLVDDNLNIRLITRNVMAVYSTDQTYVDNFLLKLKHSSYIVNNTVTRSDSIISYVKNDYNKFRNVYRFVKSKKDLDVAKFIEYISFFNLQHLLWLHFYDIDCDTISLVELIMQLSSDKPIIITSYIDSKYYDRIFSLLFHVGLEDRLIIVPIKDVKTAANNSTCQCYIKDADKVSIHSRFPEAFIKEEFGIDDFIYTGLRPSIYHKNDIILSPVSYRYSFYEYLLIILFSIKMMFIHFTNWRYLNEPRLYTGL